MDSEPFDIAPYRLPDEAFWENDDRGSDRLARELVGEYQGILIDTPSRIHVAERSTFPAGIYHLGRIRDLATVRLDRLAVVTAMNVSTNQLHVVPGTELERDTDVIERAPVDPATLPNGDMSTTYATDLRDLLTLPWKPGRYVLTILLRDTISNRPMTELFDFAPAVEPVPESPPGGVYPRPETGVTNYQPDAESPAMPASAGIAVNLTRVLDLGSDSPWRLQGAFRLRPLANELVSPGWPDESLATTPAHPRPLAILAVHLVIAGANDGSVNVVRLHVPAYDRMDDQATGYFSIDLLRLVALRSPQTYFVTAFHGACMTGPLPTALVRV